MAKKKKKLSPEEIRQRSIRRAKRSVIRLVLVFGLMAGGMVLYNPGIISNPEQRHKVEEVREKLFSESSSEQAEEGSGQLLGIWDSAKGYVEHAFKTAKIPKNIAGTEEEIVVEELVDNLTEEVKQLPAEQVKKVKTRFCQDVINEATGSANSE